MKVTRSYFKPFQLKLLCFCVIVAKLPSPLQGQMLGGNDSRKRPNICSELHRQNSHLWKKMDLFCLLPLLRESEEQPSKLQWYSSETDQEQHTALPMQRKSVMMALWEIWKTICLSLLSKCKVRSMLLFYLQIY